MIEDNSALCEAHLAAHAGSNFELRHFGHQSAGDRRGPTR